MLILTSFVDAPLAGPLPFNLNQTFQTRNSLYVELGFAYLRPDKPKNRAYIWIGAPLYRAYIRDLYDWAILPRQELFSYGHPPGIWGIRGPFFSSFHITNSSWRHV